MNFVKFPMIRCVFAFLLVLEGSNADFYTSVSEMAKLVDTEGEIIKLLSNYVDNTDIKLKYVKNKLDEFHAINEKFSSTMQEEECYKNQTVDYFLFLKRLKDFPKVLQVISDDALEQFSTGTLRDLKFPTNKDFNGAVAAILRLQQLYKMKTPDVAAGKLHGVEYNVGFSASDCFELGRQSHLTGDYHYTIPWMLEASNRFDPDEFLENVKLTDIFDYLSAAYYFEGNITESLSFIKKVLELDPNNEIALKAEEKYENDIAQGKFPSKVNNFVELESYTKFEKLCRGEITPLPDRLRSLKCYYVTGSSPFLKIAPIKMEEFSKDPLIATFYDVLSDTEIEVIKMLATPKMQGAKVSYAESGEVIESYTRIAKIAWLKDDEHKYVEKISKRVEDMTGLSVETAELLQIVNYGIGGSYSPHYDFSHKNNSDMFLLDVVGNRIATVLFYMNDVERGGATAFPEIDVAVWPKKGSASFWYNLKPDGDLDYKSVHAGCPVLVGKKWGMGFFYRGISCAINGYMNGDKSFESLAQ